jgi:hypothetical protein
MRTAADSDSATSESDFENTDNEVETESGALMPGSNFVRVGK